MSKVEVPPLVIEVAGVEVTENSLESAPPMVTKETPRFAVPEFSIVKVFVFVFVVNTVPKSVSSAVDGVVSLLTIEIPKPVTSISGAVTPELTTIV